MLEKVTMQRTQLSSAFSLLLKDPKISNWRIEKNELLTKEIQGMPMNHQRGIIKDLFVKLLLK